MNSLKLIFGATLIAIGAVMIVTNPDERAYQEYADESLNTYLKEQICASVSQPLKSFLQSHCYSLVDTTRPHLSQIVAQNTQRYNFILFSIYQTNLSLSLMLPQYNINTIGVLENFYIYQAEEI